jgi:ATP-binding cassette subfamily B protein
MINLIWRLWAHIEPRRRKQFLIIFLLTILASFAEVISIGAALPFIAAITAPELIIDNQYLKPILLNFSINDPQQILFPITLLFISAIVLSGSIRLLLLWGQNRLGHAIGSDLSVSIFKRTLYQSYLVHISENSSKAISGIGAKTNQVVYTTIMPILTIISSFFIIMSILTALIIINPLVAFSVITFFAVLYIIMSLYVRNKLSFYGEQVNYLQTKIFQLLQEGIGNVRDILMDNAQTIYWKEYQNVDRPMRKYASNIQVFSAGPRFFIESMGLILIVLLAYFLTRLNTNSSIIVPILGAIAIGAQRMLPVLQAAYASWSAIVGGKSILVAVLNLLDQPLPALQYDKQPLQFKNNIILKNIYFKYPDQSKSTLDNINLEITKGSCIGLIGETGSGKSTLLDILMGLLIPKKGKILIDDVVIDDSNNRNWQANIAHVPQNIYLSDSSIAQNIAFGVDPKDIDYARVDDACMRANIDTVIKTWPGGYNSNVGERGVKISGGQKQRIGLARALYKGSTILVLDEATSALDNETEKRVMKSINTKGSDITIIMVAHRLSSLKNCSHILKIEKGRISKICSYEELIKT